MKHIDTPQGRELLDRFLQEKVKSESSRPVLKSDIRHFFSFHTGSPETVDENVLERYKKSLGPAANPKTVKRRFSSIKKFLKYVEDLETGYTSPIGSERGDMVAFSAVNHADSDAFQSSLNLWCKKELIYSESTRRGYRNHLIQTFRHLDKEPKALTLRDLIDYHDHLTHEAIEGKRAPSSIWQRFMAVKKYLAFLEHQGRGFKTPFRKIRDIPNLEPPERRFDLTGIFTPEQLETLMRTIRASGGLKAARDYAFFSTVFSLALRIGEACRLRYRDIKSMGADGAWIIEVKGRKGKKLKRVDTTFEMPPNVTRPIRDWMKAAGNSFEPETPLFLQLKHEDGVTVIDEERRQEARPLTTRVMQKHFRDYMAASSISDKDKNGRPLRPHSLRETMATLLKNAGLHSIDLQIFLGQLPPGQLGVYAKTDLVENNPLKLLKQKFKF
jgi:site-specific recombinase XerD